MSLPGRGKGALSLIVSHPKDVRYPGQIPGQTSGASGSGRIEVFNTLITDEWFPRTGLQDGQTFYIPVDGYYNIYFEVRQPGYAAALGFGTGWSGSGNGGAYIYTNRYAQEGTTAWSTTDINQNNWSLIGPLKRYMYAGDYAQFFTYGGATGVGVIDYDAKAVITRLRS